MKIFLTANLVRHRALHHHWQRYQAQTQILRSQMGFNRVEPSRPEPCQNCAHYHGIAYGQRQRNLIICGFHPYGWSLSPDCPDWQAEIIAQ